MIKLENELENLKYERNKLEAEEKYNVKAEFGKPTVGRKCFLLTNELIQDFDRFICGCISLYYSHNVSFNSKGYTHYIEPVEVNPYRFNKRMVPMKLRSVSSMYQEPVIDISFKIRSIFEHYCCFWRELVMVFDELDTDHKSITNRVIGNFDKTDKETDNIISFEVNTNRETIKKIKRQFSPSKIFNKQRDGKVR